MDTKLVNNMHYHFNETGLGIAGTALAGGFTVTGFVASSVPILQVVSLLVGIAVGIVTFAYYWVKIRKDI